MKGSMPTYKTIDEYIADQPLESQKRLQELRAIILEAVPDAEEVINYKIPAFLLVPGGSMKFQIMMGGLSKHIGFYPFPTTIARFSEELEEFKQGKGSVQFPLNQPFPKDLIIKMVRFRKDEIEKLLDK